MAALRGGAGKTTLSLGLIAAWKKVGRKVAAFKKGPDYIDSAWLSLAAEGPCRNLDTWSGWKRWRTRQPEKEPGQSVSPS